MNIIFSENPVIAISEMEEILKALPDSIGFLRLKKLLQQLLIQYKKNMSETSKEMQRMTAAAERVLEAKRKIKELEMQIEADIELVREHSKRTGYRRYGSVEVYERKNPKRIELAVGMTEESIRKFLYKTTWRSYIKAEVDFKRILDEYESNEELRAMLDEMGIQVKQETELHLKAF